MQFLAKYGKTYVSKEDISSRFNTFSDNLDRINEHNKGDSYKMGINEFRHDHRRIRICLCLEKADYHRY